MPFSLFVTAGRAASEWVSAAFGQPATAALDWLARSVGFLRFETVAASASSQTAAGVTLAVVLGWVAVAALIATRRAIEWRRLALLVHAAPPLTAGRESDALRRVTARFPLAARVTLVRHDSRTEPGVFGIVRPMLVWPAELSDRLSDAELEAIMAHEICHVKRRDNLTALAQMIVEIIFWFHPVVWWIGTRLVVERERACDEEVLEMGTDNQSYAEGILKVCGFCLRAPARFVAGVGGSALAQRIEAIMSCRTSSSSTWVRALPIALLSLCAIVPLAAGAATASRSAAEQSGQVYKPGKDVTAPVLVREVKPQYTREALQAKIQGNIQLQAIVLESGEVGEVTVVRSLDTEHGLDVEAVNALKQWIFKPGTKDKKPVPVVVDIEMTFRLK
jgi:TonB family protein